MAKNFVRDVNIYTESCDHPELMETAKRFFIHDNSSFITDKDIAHFAGWLISNISDSDLLDSLDTGIKNHADRLKAFNLINLPLNKIRYEIEKLEKDNGKEA